MRCSFSPRGNLALANDVWAHAMCWLAGSTVSWCVRTLSLHAACTSRRLREIVREPRPLVTAPHKPYPFQCSQIDAAASPLPPFLPKRPDATGFLRRCWRHGLACHRPPGVLLSTAFPFARVLAFKAKMKWLFSYLPINCLMKCLCRNILFLQFCFLLLGVTPLVDLSSFSRRSGI